MVSQITYSLLIILFISKLNIVTFSISQTREVTIFHDFITLFIIFNHCMQSTKNLYGHAQNVAYYLTFSGSVKIVKNVSYVYSVSVVSHRSNSPLGFGIDVGHSREHEHTRTSDLTFDEPCLSELIRDQDMSPVTVYASSG